MLTDEKHFQGRLEHLAAIREKLPDGPPLLRKDFLFDEYQLYEARAHGADAVLLIVAILEQPLLEDLLDLATRPRHGRAGRGARRAEMDARARRRRDR